MASSRRVRVPRHTKAQSLTLIADDISQQQRK